MTELEFKEQVSNDGRKEFVANLDFDIIDFYLNLNIFPKIIWKERGQSEDKGIIFFGNDLKQTNLTNFKIWTFDMERVETISPIGKFCDKQLTLFIDPKEIDSEILSSKAHSNDFQIQMHADSQEKPDWIKKVESVIGFLKSSEYQKLVLSRSKEFGFEGDFPLKLAIEKTLDINSYFFLCQWSAGKLFLSVSPERLLKVRGSKVETEAIAGTRPNHPGMREELLESKKDSYEHNLVVSHLKDRFHKIVTGYSYPLTPEILELKHSIHLISPFGGYLDIEDFTFKDVEKWVKCLHPTPALGTFPAKGAVGVIREFENSDRGFYGAPMGWWSESNRSGEFIIGIRSLMVDSNKIRIQAGAGIVSESNPEEEWLETENKLENFSWLKNC